MDVPKEGPEGIEVLITDDGAWFYFQTPRFWSKLPPRRSSFHVNRHGVIWMYQVCAKILRAPAMNEGFDELAADLRAAFTIEDHIMGNTLNPEMLDAVAHTMRKKGWVKA